MEAFGYARPVPGSAGDSTSNVPDTPPRFSRGGVRLGFSTPPARSSPRIAALRADPTQSQVPAPMPQTPTRRSPRVAALRDAPPTESLIRQWETEDAFARRVAPRVDGAASLTAASGGAAGAPRRTRSVTRARRAVTGVVPVLRESPHEVNNEEKADTGADKAGDPDGGDDPDDDGDGPDDGGEDYEEEDPEDEGSAQSVDVPCTVQVTNERVLVPALKESHASWAEWLVYLKAYAKETHQHHVVKETMSAEGRNNRIAAQTSGSGHIVPDDLCPYERVYICTHGWKDKPRGKGI